MPEFPGRLRPPRLSAAPTSPAQGELYFDTVTMKLYWWDGTTWIPATSSTVSSGLPLVTSLPGSPVDGQECYYLADATLGVVWHLRYRAASASPYKWEVVGSGNWLYSYVATDEGFTTTTSWVSVASGPKITVPLAGDYEYSQDANLYVAGSQVIPFIGLGVGGATPNYPHVLGGGWAATSGGAVSVGHRNIVTGVAAGAVLLQMYSQSATTGANPHMRFRSLMARAVRVG